MYIDHVRSLSVVTSTYIERTRNVFKPVTQASSESFLAQMCASTRGSDATKVGGHGLSTELSQ